MYIEEQSFSLRAHTNALEIFRWLMPLKMFSSEGQSILGQVTLESERLNSRVLLLWPPNLFAFTSSILGVTGAYYLVVSPPKVIETEGTVDPRQEFWPPRNMWPDGDEWRDGVRNIAYQWRNQIISMSQSDSDFPNCLLSGRLESDRLENLLEGIPSDLQGLWDDFSRGFNEENIRTLLCDAEDRATQAESWQYFTLLITLHAIADEASLGWGIREFINSANIAEFSRYNLEEDSKSSVQAFAEEILVRRGTLATIHEDRCRVLPKRHNPNVGMTLRSISSSLAFYHHSSVDVKWRLSPPEFPGNLTEEQNSVSSESMSSLNVLLLPWPYRIRARDFSGLPSAHSPYENTHGKEAFFVYTPQKESNALSQLDQILRNAKEEAGKIDLVILPESAIREQDVELFESILCEHKIGGYIAGVRSDAAYPERRFARNMVYCKFLMKDNEDQLAYRIHLTSLVF